MLSRDWTKCQPVLPQKSIQALAGKISAAIALRTGHHCSFKYNMWDTLGGLDVFPPELLSSILLHADLKTLTTFRRVSSHAKHEVDHLPAYRDMITMASDVFRVILATELAARLTGHEIWTELCASTCATCPFFGHYLCLPDCRRCCVSCFTTKAGHLDICPSNIDTMFTFTEMTMEYMPLLLGSSGQYGKQKGAIRGGQIMFKGVQVSATEIDDVVLDTADVYLRMLKEMIDNQRFESYLASPRFKFTIPFPTMREWESGLRGFVWSLSWAFVGCAI